MKKKMFKGVVLVLCFLFILVNAINISYSQLDQNNVFRATPLNSYLLCNSDSDCPSAEYSDNYCFDNHLYQDVAWYQCSKISNVNNKLGCKKILNKNIIEPFSPICNNQNNNLIDDSETNHINLDSIDHSNTLGHSHDCNDNPVMVCKGNDVYSKTKCHETFVKTCSNGCYNGECISNVICRCDSDCGTNGFVDGLYCKDNAVYQKFKTFTCQNPGKSNSYCLSSVSEVLKNQCNSGESCIDGQCKQQIKCWKDLDCGTNSFIDGAFCKDNSVFQKFITFTCNNPGTTQSYCSNSVSDKLKNDCGSGVCTNGQCQEINCCQDSDCGANHFIDGLFCKDNSVFQKFVTYTCNNPGTIQSYCSNSISDKLKNHCDSGACSNGQCQQIICSKDSDCGTDHFIDGKFCKDGSVYQNFIDYECKNPGTVNSICSNDIIKKLIEDCGNKGCDDGKCNTPTNVCDRTRTTVGIPVILPNTGVKFTALSNAVSGPINTLTLSAQNMDNYYKTLTYSKLSCRCSEHSGNPIGPDGLGACNFFWSGELISPSCKVVEESITLAPYETRNIQVDVKQYQDKICGSFQLDFILTKVNGAVVSGTDGQRLVGWSFTDLCQDCRQETNIKCSATTEFLSPMEKPAGLRFTGISNTLNGPVNTYAVQIQNLENINKVVTYSKGLCRCSSHLGDSYDSGHSVCNSFWSGGANSPSCLLVPDTISLGPYESKIVQVQTAQYLNRICGSTQLDLYVDSVNGVPVAGDLSNKIIGGVFTDLCQDC